MQNTNIKSFTYEIFKSLLFNREEDALFVDLATWNDILEDDNFSNIFENSTPLMIKQGLLCYLDGLKIYTDAHLPPKLHFLNRGTAYLAKEKEIVKWLSEYKLPVYAIPVFTALGN